MKRSAVCTALIAIIVMISQTSTSRAQEKFSVTVAQRPTVIRNVQVRANVPRIVKPKLFRSNPHRAVYYALNINQNDDIGIDDDDKITGYRREDLQRIHTESTTDNPEGLTDDIRWRLFLARQLAMLKYNEVHS